MLDGLRRPRRLGSRVPAADGGGGNDVVTGCECNFAPASGGRVCRLPPRVSPVPFSPWRSGRGVARNGVNLHAYRPRARYLFDWYIEGERLNVVLGGYDDWYVGVPIGEFPN